MATVKQTKPTQKEKQLEKTKKVSALHKQRSEFADAASNGTLPKLSQMKPNLPDLEPADKLTDWMDRWILILGREYVATPNSKFGGDGMLLHIVDRDAKKHKVWCSGTLREILESEETPVTYPTITKIVRPGRAYVPTREDAPDEVVSFFERYIQQNGASFKTDEHSQN